MNTQSASSSNKDKQSVALANQSPQECMYLLKPSVTMVSNLICCIEQSQHTAEEHALKHLLPPSPRMFIVKNTMLCCLQIELLARITLSYLESCTGLCLIFSVTKLVL